MANKENKNKEPKANKNKKSFTKDLKAELKKVVWLTPKQLLNNTIAVVTIVIITAVIIFVLDVAFEAMNKHGVEKVKNVIESSSENTSNENTDAESDNTSTEAENTESNETNENSSEENTTTESSETENTENNSIQ